MRKSSARVLLASVPCGFALPGGLEASGNSGSVESLQRGAVADHLDFLYHDLGTRKVIHVQFINQVNAPVRTHEGHGRILHREQKRRHAL